MKAESLYHLLQIRARKLEEGADPALQRQLRAVQADLKVSHSRGWFEVTWRHAGRDFSLNVPEHDFTFYVAGDTAKAVEQRGVTGSVRLRNWQAAAALWGRIGQISGFAVPASSSAASMGLTPLGPALAATCPRSILAGSGVAALGLLVGSSVMDWQPALSCAALAILLTWLLPPFVDTHLRRPFAIWEVVLVTVSAFLPLAWGNSPAWLAAILTGLVALTWMETLEADLPILLCLGGGFVGLCTWELGWAGLLPSALLGVGHAALRLLAPKRVAAKDALALLAGLSAGSLLGLLLPSSPSSAVEAVPMVVLGTVLLIAFVLWPFHGSLFRVSPWLALGTLAFASFGATLAMETGTIALAGFAAVISIRLARALIGAATGSRIVRSKGTTTR